MITISLEQIMFENIIDNLEEYKNIINNHSSVYDTYNYGELQEKTEEIEENIEFLKELMNASGKNIQE